MNRGLYIHFPFCRNKCNYCGFYSTCDLSLTDSYIDALLREIKGYEGRGIRLDTVYFGGGTPSLMKIEQLRSIMKGIKSSFELERDAEITIEANPVTVKDSSLIYALRESGINRLSLGVQSFSDSELVALSRTHTAKEALDTLRLARDAGFDNISADLMFGLPGQKTSDFDFSLDKALECNLDHISLYALSIEEKTVFGHRQKRGEDLQLPSEDEVADMYVTACRKLSQNGFEHYEISNFAKEGRRSRHNIKYWRGEEYIGIGAAAHSYFEGERYSVPDSIKRFLVSSEKENSYMNTPRDRKEEKVFLNLRLSDGLDLSDFSPPDRTAFLKKVAQLEDGGFCAYGENRLVLTEKGMFVSNAVISEILEVLI